MNKETQTNGQYTYDNIDNYVNWLNSPEGDEYISAMWEQYPALMKEAKIA